MVRENGPGKKKSIIIKLGINNYLKMKEKNGGLVPDIHFRWQYYGLCSNRIWVPELVGIWSAIQFFNNNHDNNNNSNNDNKLIDWETNS